MNVRVLFPVIVVAFCVACGGASAEPDPTRVLDAARTRVASTPTVTATATPEPVRYLGVVLHPAMVQDANDGASDGPCKGILFSGAGAVSEVFTKVLSKNSACFTVTGAPPPAGFIPEYAALLRAEGWTLTESKLTGILDADGPGLAGTRKQGTERMALGYANGAVFLAVIPAK